MDFDFKILIETISGSQYSYATESLVNLTAGTSQVVTTTDMVDKINSMPSSSFGNKGVSKELTFSVTDSFGETNLNLPSALDHQFLSMSIKDHEDSGSILFTENTTTFGGDYLKRYKFFGNKVCNVIGVPENYWIYTDRFRLSNTASLSNHIEGDISATSITVRNNFNVSNIGSISSDLPFNLSKDSDRWIKYVDVSGSVPLNKMLIGYSQGEDYYGIKMPYSTDNLLLSASCVSASGEIKTEGIVFASGFRTPDGGGGYIPTVTANQTSSFLTEVNIGDVQGTLTSTGRQGTTPTTLSPLTDLGTSGKPLFGAITSSGDISSSGAMTAVRYLIENGLPAISVTNDAISLGSASTPVLTAGNLTASGNISASGAITAPSFTNINTTNITASVVSSSDKIITSQVGDETGTHDLLLRGDNVTIQTDASGDITFKEATTTKFKYDGGEDSFKFTGNITASANISSSATSTGSFGRIEAEGNISASGQVHGDSLATERYIYHANDPDTYIDFSSDNIVLNAGGRQMLWAHEGTQDVLYIGKEGEDVDFQVQTVPTTQAIKVVGSTGLVGINGNPGGTSQLQVIGDITTTHITASGNISSSGLFTSGNISGSAYTTASFGELVINSNYQNNFQRPGIDINSTDITGDATRQRIQTYNGQLELLSEETTTGTDYPGVVLGTLQPGSNDSPSLMLEVTKRGVQINAQDGTHGDLQTSINTTIPTGSALSVHANEANNLSLVSTDTSLQNGQYFAGLSFVSSDGVGENSHPTTSNAGIVARAAEQHSSTNQGTGLEFRVKDIDDDDSPVSSSIAYRINPIKVGDSESDNMYGDSGADLHMAHHEFRGSAVFKTLPNIGPTQTNNVYLTSSGVWEENSGSEHGTGKLGIYWNKTDGHGEVDFFSQRGGALANSDARGGYNFYDIDPGNGTNELLRLRNEGYTSVRHQPDYDSGWFAVAKNNTYPKTIPWTFTPTTLPRVKIFVSDVADPTLGTDEVWELPSGQYYSNGGMNAYIEYSTTTQIKIHIGTKYVFYANTSHNGTYLENSGYYLVQAWK